MTTSDGKKMGKTMKGALWLDEKKTTPYEFYQYWRNIEDQSVEKCLKFLTFLELDKISSLTRGADGRPIMDERINQAKSVLALEVTKLIHGEAAALEAERQAVAAFSGNAGDMPEYRAEAKPVKLIDLLTDSGLAPSKSEARRLIEGGGIRIDGEAVLDLNYVLTLELLKKGFILYKGKKVRVHVVTA